MAQVRDQVVFFLCFFFLLAGSWCCTSAAVLLTRTGVRYVVGGREKWRTPETLDMYAKWAAAVQLYVGDSIEFVYKNNSVIKTDKFGYYHCNVTDEAANDGSVLFLLDEPGFAYFTSGDVSNCKKGQRLMLSVQSDPAPAPSPASPIVRPPPSTVVMTPTKSPSPSPAPKEPAATTSAASATAAHALVVVVSVTAVAMMVLVLGEW